MGTNYHYTMNTVIIYHNSLSFGADVTPTQVDTKCVPMSHANYLLFGKRNIIIPLILNLKLEYVQDTSPSSWLAVVNGQMDLKFMAFWLKQNCSPG